MRQCDGIYGATCSNFVCPKTCGTGCSCCEKHFCFDCFSEMHSDHEMRLESIGEAVRETEGEPAAAAWWAKTNAYFRQDTPLFIEGCGWVCVDCANDALDQGQHQAEKKPE